METTIVVNVQSTGTPSARPTWIASGEVQTATSAMSKSQVRLPQFQCNWSGNRN